MRRLLNAATTASLLLAQVPVLAQQFTPQQMLDVMIKSPNNRDVRVQDAAPPKLLFVVGESATPSNRDVRVHDSSKFKCAGKMGCEWHIP